MNIGRSALCTVDLSKMAATSPPAWFAQPPFTPGEGGFSPKHRASCFCGRVRFSVSCEPVASKLCDCTVCQRLHAAPCQWAALFPKDAVRFEPESAPWLRFYSTTLDAVFEGDGAADRPLPVKIQCRHCGGWVADEGRRMLMAFPTLFPEARGLVGVRLVRVAGQLWLWVWRAVWLRLGRVTVVPACLPPCLLLLSPLAVPASEPAAVPAFRPSCPPCPRQPAAARCDPRRPRPRAPRQFVTGTGTPRWPRAFLPTSRIFCSTRALAADDVALLPSFADDQSAPATAADFLGYIAPRLDGAAHKGQGGRIGVLGGSIDYGACRSVPCVRVRLFVRRRHVWPALARALSVSSLALCLSLSCLSIPLSSTRWDGVRRVVCQRVRPSTPAWRR